LNWSNNGSVGAFIIKIRLILGNLQESEPFNWFRRSIFTRNKVEKTILLFFCILIVFTLFKTAHAGFSYFNPNEDYKPVSNSQNLALLEKKPDLSEGYSSSGSIIENSVLVSDLSLSGIGGAEIVTPSNDQISMYVVRDGDTLSEIAEMFGVTVNTIKWANDITSTPKTGDILVILPVSGVRHKVEKGDTLETIAKKYSGNPSDVAKFNGLSPDAEIAIGDEIIVPNGEIQPKKSPNKPPAKNSGARIATVPSKNLPAYSGYYIRPIVGGTRTQGIHGNNAVDLAHKPGTPMYASAAGQVLVAKTNGWNGGYGNYIVISHDNGSQTLYAHLNSVTVAVGQSVGQGEVIGALGSSGNSTGPHVHFEIRGAKNPF